MYRVWNIRDMIEQYNMIIYLGRVRIKHSNPQAKHDIQSLNITKDNCSVLKAIHYFKKSYVGNELIRRFV